VRTLTRVLLPALALGAAVVLVGTPAAALASSASGANRTAPPPAAAAIGVHGDTSAFTFDSFDADYELGRDASKHSTLHVTETLVARFPDFDQNHGIVRDIPSAYDGHSVHLKVLSVTDGAGTKREFTTGTRSEGGDFLELKIGDPNGIDRFLHGTQTFRIVYTAQNVTKYFRDTGDDEFYWDVNGTGWDQPFGSVTAKVLLRDGIASALNGNASCYQGYAGSTAPCEIAGDGGRFTASAKDLHPRQNMTVAIGFDKGTFAAAPFSIFDIVPVLAVIATLAILASLVLAIVFRFVIWRPRSGDPIIAQYEPPAGVSAMLAANIVNRSRRGMAASIVDLAVRKKLRMVERQGGGWIKSENYGVQKLDDRGLLPDEQMVMNALFGAFGVVGFTGVSLPPGLQLIGAASTAPAPPEQPAVRWLQKKDVVLGQAVREIQKQVEAEALATGLRRGRPHGILALCLLLGLGGLLCFLLLSMSGEDADVGWGVVGLNVGIWVEVFALGAVGSIKPLSATGSKLWDQLEGLKLYIRLAEADRLRMLQSVTGAERIDTSDGSQIVKIYERLLPYAVLFGLEDEWARELAKYYGDSPPDWYDGNMGTFSAVAFAGALGAFSSSASSSLSGSSSSSSSGGSSGGGSSGGGGGGGGGGGF
jgi:hypothetical protein